MTGVHVLINGLVPTIGFGGFLVAFVGLPAYLLNR